MYRQNFINHARKRPETKRRCARRQSDTSCRGQGCGHYAAANRKNGEASERLAAEQARLQNPASQQWHTEIQNVNLGASQGRNATFVSTQEPEISLGGQHADIDDDGDLGDGNLGLRQTRWGGKGPSQARAPQGGGGRGGEAIATTPPPLPPE